MNLAIISSPEIILSYRKVLISKGVLAPAEYASALVNEDGNIVFSRTDNSGTGSAKETDTLIMVAFFPDSKTAVYKFSTATREDGAAILKMESNKGVAETWIGFLNADKKNAANSVYTGAVSL